MQTKLSSVLNSFLDLIYPKFRLNCKQEGSWLCSQCHSKLIIRKEQICPFCQKISPKGICPNCQRKHFLSGSYILGYHKDPILKELIHFLKYENIKEISPILSSLLLENIKPDTLPKKCLMIPVPLSRQRKNSRGYNQSELITRELSKYFQLGINTKNLVKIKNTKSQISLNYHDRIKNQQGAFILNNPQKIQNQNIVLVDDVITTGATIGECAKILKQAGAKKIFLIALAHG